MALLNMREYLRISALIISEILRNIIRNKRTWKGTWWRTYFNFERGEFLIMFFLLLTGQSGTSWLSRMPPWLSLHVAAEPLLSPLWWLASIPAQQKRNPNTQSAKRRCVCRQTHKHNNIKCCQSSIFLDMQGPLSLPDNCHPLSWAQEEESAVRMLFGCCSFFFFFLNSLSRNSIPLHVFNHTLVSCIDTYL